MISAWDTVVESELEWLGLAAQILESESILAGPLLHPSGDWEPGDAVQVVTDDIALEPMSEAFQALTTDYRLQLLYLARVICIDGPPGGRRRAWSPPSPPRMSFALSRCQHDRADHRHRGRAGRRAAPARARVECVDAGDRPAGARVPHRPRGPAAAAAHRLRAQLAVPRPGAARAGPGACCASTGARRTHDAVRLRLVDPARRFVPAPVRAAAVDAGGDTRARSAAADRWCPPALAGAAALAVARRRRYPAAPGTTAIRGAA